jgi:DNA segregation ATPase FtsK/SpoIIIE-like protein
MQVVDPDDRDLVRSVLEQLRNELDRRAVSESDPGVDVVIVIRELAVVASQAWDLLDPLLSDGSRHGIRLLAASERPANELTANCPGLDGFRTRLILQTADEDASQALLGSAGAEELPPGGSMLLRLEARTPLRAHGFRVAPDDLARLVALMEQRDSSVPSAPVPPQVCPLDDGCRSCCRIRHGRRRRPERRHRMRCR